MWPWNGPGANLTEAGRRPASAWPGRVPRATLFNFSLGKGGCQEHRLGSARMPHEISKPTSPGETTPPRSTSVTAAPPIGKP